MKKPKTPVIIIAIIIAIFMVGIIEQSGNAASAASNERACAMITVAASQVGNNGEPYWSWYGFDNRVSWCACFVSWCADQCGYINACVIPKFSSCPVGIAWFQEEGLWQPANGYVPRAGDIIFFDRENNGTPDHVGIVEDCSGDAVSTIEGNCGDQCLKKTYSLSSSLIVGYGTPAY